MAAHVPPRPARFWQRGLAAAVLAVLLAGNGVAAGPAIEGPWAGEHIQLEADAQGARIEADCASGTIAGPLRPGADGRFAATGTFDAQQAGPQAANAPSAAAARYTGRVQDDLMTLSILAPGASEAQTFTLRRGARVKLRRCR